MICVEKDLTVEALEGSNSLLLLETFFFLNKVVLMNVIERTYRYPVKWSPAPPCSHTLLLTEVEDNLMDFFPSVQKTIFLSKFWKLCISGRMCRTWEDTESSLICQIWGETLKVYSIKEFYKCSSRESSRKHTSLSNHCRKHYWRQFKHLKVLF